MLRVVRVTGVDRPSRYLCPDRLVLVEVFGFCFAHKSLSPCPCARVVGGEGEVTRVGGLEDETLPFTHGTVRFLG